jgi:hypothetical protein
MTKCSIPKLIAILLAANVLPVSAHVVSPQTAYAPYVPHVNFMTADATSSVSTARPWKPGSETTTMPWSAPAGHHQPTAADVVETNRRQTLDQDDANIDRIVRGICRGC